MAKGKRDIGREILEGLREIKSGRHGRVVNLPSVASIREKTGLSQERFATLLGVSIRTLKDWEQGPPSPVWRAAWPSRMLKPGRWRFSAKGGPGERYAAGPLEADVKYGMAPVVLQRVKL